MFASVQAVRALGNVLDNFVQNGAQPTLTAFNLGQYVGASALDVLAALADVVAPATGQLDDAMARQAYALMVDRIISNTSLDMDNLQPEDVQEILAVFIEETIICRVINDIGASLTAEQHDPAICANLVEDLYQIVHGAVHNDIISGLQGVHPDLPPDTGQRMEDIYQLALEILSNV